MAHAKKIIKRVKSVDIVLYDKSAKNLLLIAVLSGESPNILKQLGYDISYNTEELRTRFANLLWDAEEEIIKSEKNVVIKNHTFS